MSETDATTMLVECYKFQVASTTGNCGDLGLATMAHIAAAAKWLTTGTKSGLLIYGTIGNGKTTLLNAIAKLLLIAGNRVLTTHTALDLAYLAKEKSAEFNQICKYPFLGIDDMGTEPESVKCWGTEQMPMVDMLGSRYETRTSTLTAITSNLNLEDLAKRYGKRIADRVTEQYERIAFTTESFRKSI